MLTGKRAFTHATHADTVAAILREDPPSLTSLGIDAPARLDRIISRCLKKNPTHRFQSAADLAYALRESRGEASSRPATPATLTDRPKSVAVLEGSVR